MTNAALSLRLMLLCALSTVSGAEARGAPPDTSILPADRKVDWTLAGIPSGIPNRMQVFRTIDAARYGNGTADATREIQDAIDNAPAGQVVLLPAGTYVTSDTIHLRSDKTLRGAGQGETTIRYQGQGGRSVLDLRGQSYNDIWGLKRSYPITGGAARDSKQITLGRTDGIKERDVLLIDQLNDGVLVDIAGSQGVCTYCSREDGKRARGQFAEVTAVSGITVTLSLPLFFSLEGSLQPEATLVSAGSMVRRAGVEDLTLTQDQPVNEHIVDIDSAQHCWLKNVEISRMNRRGCWHVNSFQNEIRGCTFRNAINGFGRDHGYGLELSLQSTANLVEDNIFETVDGGGVMTDNGAIGNVIAYNYLHNIQFDEPHWMIAGPVLNHSPHPSMNLWEGNIGPQLGNDFIHGSSSHNTVFRCRSTGWRDELATSNNNAVEFQHKNLHMTVIGCVLGTKGKSDTYEVAWPQPAPAELKPIWRLGYGGPKDDGDPNVKATLLRHGNWDSVTDGVVWDPAIADHTLPASFYRSSRPDWWGDLAWPPIGPDVPGMAGKIPAQVRFEGRGDR
jgi:hypothetical protein